MLSSQRECEGLTQKPLRSDFLPKDNAGGVVVVDMNSDNEAQRLHEPEAITVSLSDSADRVVVVESDNESETHGLIPFCTSCDNVTRMKPKLLHNKSRVSNHSIIIHSFYHSSVYVMI